MALSKLQELAFEELNIELDKMNPYFMANPVHVIHSLNSEIHKIIDRKEGEDVNLVHDRVIKELRQTQNEISNRLGTLRVLQEEMSKGMQGCRKWINAIKEDIEK